MDYKTETDCTESEQSHEKSDLYSKDENEFSGPMLQENVSLDIPNQSRVSLKDSINRDSFCGKLEKLNVSGCNLFKVPEVVFKYKYLTDLNLSNNALEYLPNEIRNLPNLISLNLSENKLNSLPKLLKHNHQLTYLNLSNNNFTAVPDVLYCGLRMIETLDMSCNEITYFSEAPKCSDSLLELRLRGNKLREIPKWLFNSPCQLQILELAINEIKCGPVINYYSSKIFQTLRVLNLENCNFRYESIKFLRHFKNIEILHIGNNREFDYKDIKTNVMGNLDVDVFKNFLKLKELSLNNVSLGIVPSRVYPFTNIEFVNLSDNLLSWLPESFCHLISLKILDLTSNQLLFLPNNIGDLVNLQEIYLRRNKLNELPHSFNDLTNLELVDLYDNKIEVIDQRVILLKKLRGMDLGMNCLDLSTDGNDSDAVWKRYDMLKISYRKRFGCVNRSDVQAKVDENLNEISISNEYSDDTSSIISDNDSVSGFEESSNQDTVVTSADVPNEELWEEVSEVEIDDLFDPNAKSYPSNSFNIYSAFEKNYCPAYSNVQSLRLTFRGSYDLNNVFEGQFDSD